METYDIESIFIQLINKFSNKEDIPKSNLYHFTTIQGLKGFLSSRKLWLTHYDSLNDSLEIKTAHNIILNEIKSKSLKHTSFWKIFTEKFTNILEIGDYYICSFTANVNNQNLWQKYADKSQGVAIGFRREYFSPSIPLNKNKMRYNLIVPLKIHYTHDEFLKYINKILDQAENLLDDGAIYPEIASIVAVSFLPLLPKLKTSEWNNEEEHRIYQFGYTDEHNRKLEKKDKIFAIPKVIRFEKERILRKIQQKNVIEVWRKHSCNLTEKQIQELLHKFQFTNVKILNF